MPGREDIKSKMLNLLSMERKDVTLDYKDFGVDLSHLFEDIESLYTYDLEQAAIVENIDNAIDERYTHIDLQPNKGDLRILMVGDGMSKEIFEEVLPKIAATTKYEDFQSLGRHGWGMKIGMRVAEEMWIETKKGDYHRAQSWRVIDRRPKYGFSESLKLFIDQDFTLVELMGVHRTENFKGYDEAYIRQTIQKFYPTILSGIKVKNRYGEARKIVITINSDPIPPPELPEVEKRCILKAKVADEEATGYVYLVSQKLPDEEQGINIIVRGRAIKRDFFGVYFGDKRNRITGYIHADFLLPDLYGDKTNLKITGRYRALLNQISKKLYKFGEEIGAIESLPVGDVFRRACHEINKVMKSFPELKDLFKKTGLIGDQFMPKKGGGILSKIEEGMVLGRGEEPGGEGGEGVPIGPGNEEGKAPSGKPGEKEAVRKRGRIGLEFKPIKDPGREESWFSPPGIIYINQAAPTYKKAEKFKKTLQYHVGRVAIEAILTFAIERGYIKPEEAKSFRLNVLYTWGQL
jgi:hypothetical protein